MIVSLIAAVSKNKVIGHEGKIPWHLPADLAHFKSLTLGHTVIMGRKTCESLEKALPGRRNVVLSRSPDFHPQDFEVIPSLKEALELVHGSDEVFVIGGQSVYEEALELADKIYLTRVDAEIKGDALFPDFSDEEWSVVSSEMHEKDEKNLFNYTYVTYERKPVRL